MKLAHIKKNKIIFTTALSVFLILLISILAIDKLNFCSTNHLYENANALFSIFCSQFVGEGILLPIWIFSGVVAVISFILLFLKKQIFTAWKKFAIYFIAISAIWIIIAPEGCGGGFGGFGGCVFDKETTAMFTAGLFFIISLFIIAIKSWRLRK